MFSSLRRSSAFVMLAAAALAGGSIPVLPAMISAAPRPVRDSKRSLFGGSISSSRHGRKGAGITMAQQQRSAAKKRGVARNRRNHR
jgi:hypothetical protein